MNDNVPEAFNDEPAQNIMDIDGVLDDAEIEITSAVALSPWDRKSPSASPSTKIGSSRQDRDMQTVNHEPDQLTDEDNEIVSGNDACVGEVGGIAINGDSQPYRNRQENKSRRERSQQPSHSPSKDKAKAPLPGDSWKQSLYSPLAGTTTPGALLIQKLKSKGLATPLAIAELSRYVDYELEHFTFLQEIIPNLFLGRYLKLYRHGSNLVYGHWMRRLFSKHKSRGFCQ